MYKKILVPVDGSPTSVCGLGEAIRLAKNQGATLRLVHVVDEFLLSSSYMPVVVDNTAYLKAVREGGQEVLKKMQAETSGHGLTVESELLETVGGRPSDLIVKAATQWGADLIVMGTHGRRGMRRLLIGSDAALVISSSPVPVLLVRGPEAT